MKCNVDRNAEPHWMINWELMVDGNYGITHRVLHLRPHQIRVRNSEISIIITVVTGITVKELKEQRVPKDDDSEKEQRALKVPKERDASMSDLNSGSEYDDRLSYFK